MKKLLPLCMLLCLTYTAISWELTGASQSKIWSSQPCNTMSLSHHTDVRIWGKPKAEWDIEGYLRYELDQESWEDTSHYRGLSRKLIRLSHNIGSLTAVNFYVTLGRGLALNCIEEKNTGIDRDLEGADISLYLADIFEIRALGGWLRQNTTLDTTRTLAGSQLGASVLPRLKFYTIYLRSNAGYKKQTEVFGRPTEEIYGGAIQSGLGPMEAYAEFDVRHVYGRMVDPIIGWQGSDDLKGQAAYISLNLSLSGLALSLDAKDYRRFNAGFNAPPAANREGWLLNEGYDERGYQVQATTSPLSFLTLTANHSWAQSRNDYRWPFMPEYPRDSIGRYSLQDYLAEVKLELSQRVALTAETQRRKEINLQPDVKTKYYRGGDLEFVCRYGRRSSLTHAGG